ncbi:DUF6893 family small protein [Lolliginicoccus suaedae]
MRIVGMITTAVVSAIAALGVMVGIKSIPDMKRYMRMRQM